MAKVLSMLVLRSGFFPQIFISPLARVLQGHLCIISFAAILQPTSLPPKKSIRGGGEGVVLRIHNNYVHKGIIQTVETKYVCEHLDFCWLSMSLTRLFCHLKL